MQVDRVGILAAVVLILDVASSMAQVRYVDDTATGANTGLSWCDAFVRLQDALVVPNITEIRVAQGIYRPDRTAAAPGGSGSRVATFQLPSWRTVRGGYAGCGAPNPDARNVAAFESILSGDLAGNDGPNFSNNAENSYHVVTYSEMQASGVVLDGFTVTGGNADGTGPAGTITNQGSALHIRNDNFKCIPGGPTIRQCTFRNNWAIHHGAVNDHGFTTTIENCMFRDNYGGEEGAGLLIHSGSPTVRDSVFFNNHCDGQGGGVWISHDSDASCSEVFSRPTFTRCTFDGNTAAAEGGGLYAENGSEAVLENCTFTGNHSAVKGGGVYLHNSSWGTMSDCEISGNSADTDGGGVFAAPGARPTMDRCTMFNNSANRGGGIYASSFAHPTLTDCTISDNHAVDRGGGGNFAGSQLIAVRCLFESNVVDVAYGGGAYINGGTVDFTDCTFQENSSPTGGGAYVFASTADFENCTFIENQATSNGQGGGGVYNAGYVNNDSNLFLRNCRFIGNTTAGEGAGLYSYNRSSATLLGCTFVGNSAARNGGGFQSYLANPASISNCRFFGNSAQNGGGAYNYRDYPTYVNCLFHGNTATGQGGGIVSASNNMTFINCTIAGNSAESGGGINAAIDSQQPEFGDLRFTNSIFWGNADQSGMGQAAQIHPVYDAAPVITYSIVQGWDGSLAGANNLDADPLFANPAGADNTPGTEDDDLHLAHASPAANAGDNSAVPAGVTVDLDGKARISDLVVDMGAFEIEGTCPNGSCNSGEDRCNCPADCGAPLASESNCNDGLNEDCDVFTDCQDSDCTQAANCQPPPIPAASSWGLLIFALLVTTSGTLLSRRFGRVTKQVFASN